MKLKEEAQRAEKAEIALGDFGAFNVRGERFLVYPGIAYASVSEGKVVLD